MLRFASIATAAALVLGTTMSAQTAKPQAAKPGAVLASLQGTWQMTIVNGQDMPSAGQEIIITIKDNSYVQTVNGAVQERGTFKIDESKKPHHLDIVASEGDDAGKIQLGIFEITGKTLKGSLAEPGLTTRPADLAEAPGLFVFTMIRK